MTAGSISQWIEGAKCGDADAVQALWERYFAALVGFARRKLQSVPRQVADEEDIALSAFASFSRAVERGRFTQLTDRNDLWRLLMRITARKAVDQIRYHCRQVRGGGNLRGATALELAVVIGDEPTPEFAALLADELQRLLDSLADDASRTMAVLKLEGYTNQEIADKQDCSLSTVERQLRMVRKRWERESGDGR
jgi:RNA polymerase sigma factor (sigma-70 family)